VAPLLPLTYPPERRLTDATPTGCAAACCSRTFPDASAPAGRLVEEITAAFELMGMPLPRRWAQTLVAAALDVPHAELGSHFGRRLGPEGRRFEEVFREASPNAPVAYLVGRAPFLGLDFEVSSRETLIPKVDTELFVGIVLEDLERHPLPKYPRVLELCTGSGCIAVSLASRVRKDGAWFYYRCVHHWHNGRNACPNGKNLNVNKVEPPVWQFVSELLRDPTRVRAGLEALMEQERKGTRGDANREAKAWLDRLAQADMMCHGFQEQAAKGLMTLDELEHRLRDIDEARETARAELATLEGSRRRLEELEHDQEALMERYAGVVPEALENLAPEERHRVYKMLRLRVLAYPDARLEVSGVRGICPDVCLYEPISMPPPNRSWLPRAGSCPL
jgi:hypothetical protein